MRWSPALGPWSSAFTRLAAYLRGSTVHWGFGHARNGNNGIDGEGLNGYNAGERPKLRSTERPMGARGTIPRVFIIGRGRPGVEWALLERYLVDNVSTNYKYSILT
jgi:hypothetical protein